MPIDSNTGFLARVTNFAHNVEKMFQGYAGIVADTNPSPYISSLSPTKSTSASQITDRPLNLTTLYDPSATKPAPSPQEPNDNNSNDKNPLCTKWFYDLCNLDNHTSIVALQEYMEHCIKSPLASTKSDETTLGGECHECSADSCPAE